MAPPAPQDAAPAPREPSPAPQEAPPAPREAPPAPQEAPPPALLAVENGPEGVKNVVLGGFSDTTDATAGLE